MSAPVNIELDVKYYTSLICMASHPFAAVCLSVWLLISNDFLAARADGGYRAKNGIAEAGT